MTGFPTGSSNHIPITNLNQSTDKPKDARDDLFKMAQRVNEIIDSFDANNGICGLTGSGKVDSSKLIGQIDTAQLAPDAVDGTKIEDDAINCSTDEEIYDVINELDKIKDWEILCLGKSHHEIRGHPFQDDVKLLNKTVYGQSWFGAHAYILNRKSAQKLIDNFFPITFAVDVYMEEILDNLTPEISLIRQISHLGYFKETFIKDSDTFGNYLEWGHDKHTLNIRQSCADFTIFESIELHDSVPKKAESPHDIPYQKGILKK